MGRGTGDGGAKAPTETEEDLTDEMSRELGERCNWTSLSPKWRNFLARVSWRLEPFRFLKAKEDFEERLPPIRLSSERDLLEEEG